MAKPKLAIYWAASCGGCDIAILDIEDKILAVADFFDMVFWPCAMDFKYKDVEAMEDKSITLTLFNGAIRSDENYEMAEAAAAEVGGAVRLRQLRRGGVHPGPGELHDQAGDSGLRL